VKGAGGETGPGLLRIDFPGEKGPPAILQETRASRAAMSL
jgi:hypothetical protein